MTAAQMAPGPRNLITDVGGLRVGNAQEAALKSGTTVLTADAPFTASVAVQGGAPGTRETDPPPGPMRWFSRAAPPSGWPRRRG